jgi:RNA polymerase sigma-70 factor (ECF subfamily)
MARLDLEGLEAVYYERKFEIRGFLSSLTGDRDEADDLLQVVFERMIQLVIEGRVNGETVRPFLYRLAYNAFVDDRRRRAREKGALRDIVDRSGSRSNPIDSSADLTDAVQAVLEEALTVPGITRRQKDILRLRFLSQLQIAEIENILRISRPTIHRELQRIREVLKPRFTAAGLAPGDLEESA